MAPFDLGEARGWNELSSALLKCSGIAKEFENTNV